MHQKLSCNILLRYYYTKKITFLENCSEKKRENFCILQKYSKALCIVQETLSVVYHTENIKVPNNAQKIIKLRLTHRK